MKDTGFIVFPLEPKAWIVWLCMMHIMQKPSW